MTIAPAGASESSPVSPGATQLTLSTNAGTNPGVGTTAFPHAIGCSSAGNCTAVGGYVDSPGEHQVMVVTSLATPTTPTIGNLPASGTYGGNFTAIVSTNGDGSTSVTSNSTSICTVSGFVVSYVGVGTCSLTAHVSAGTDYGAADGSAQTFTVDQASQTISFTAPASGSAGGWRRCQQRAGRRVTRWSSPSTHRAGPGSATCRALRHNGELHRYGQLRDRRQPGGQRGTTPRPLRSLRRLQSPRTPGQLGGQLRGIRLRAGGLERLVGCDLSPRCHAQLGQRRPLPVEQLNHRRTCPGERRPVDPQGDLLVRELTARAAALVQLLIQREPRALRPRLGQHRPHRDDQRERRLPWRRGGLTSPPPSTREHGWCSPSSSRQAAR